MKTKANLKAVEVKIEDNNIEFCGCNCRTAGDVIHCITQAQSLLAILKAMFRDEDLEEIRGLELDGLKKVVEGAFKKLESAVTLHCANH